MRISQRHIKEIFKARYISFDLHKISAFIYLKKAKTSATLTFIIGQTILLMVKQKKTCVHFFFIYPKM